MESKKIMVTSPLLPPLDEFVPFLEKIWRSKWLTNNGEYHQQLEKALCEYLGVQYISLFTNGTLPLVTALHALDISGEVITSPYSFVATTHAIWWNRLTPVFVDIDKKTGNIDPEKIEAAITPRTKAIMPVHVYGTPCDVEKIQEIADQYKLKIIYDAAHAFGVNLNGQSVLNYGDISTLSFHATKAYNTIEGGALVCHSPEMKRDIDYLKNFGFSDETTVIAPGINSKMDEVRAAYGLLNLKYIDESINTRKEVFKQYESAFSGVRGLSLLTESRNVKQNYSYYPIFIDAMEFGLSRDVLYEKLKSNNIYGRRYFYPLISEFPMYRNLSSSNPRNLMTAKKMSESVICIPMYAGLQKEEVERIVNIILN